MENVQLVEIYVCVVIYIYIFYLSL